MGKYAHVPRGFYGRLPTACQHKCPQPWSCGKTFTTKYVARRHVRFVHEGACPYACQRCSQSFRCKAWLENHMQRVHGDGSRKYPCPHCKKFFVSQQSASIHVYTVHTKPKYKCDRCETVFRTPGLRRNHVKIVHDKVREHRCTACPSTFGYAWGLRYHIRTVHENERRFPCTRCQHTAKRAEALAKHERCVHDGEREDCPECGASLSHGRLRLHLRNTCTGGIHMDKRCVAICKKGCAVGSRCTTRHRTGKSTCAKHKNFKSVKTTRARAGANANAELCAICLEAGAGAADAALSCGHKFHPACLRKHAAALATTCPTCRTGFDGFTSVSTSTFEALAHKEQAVAEDYADDGRDEHEVCVECGEEELAVNGDARQLICDTCDKICHAHCAGISAANPEPPTGDWSCPRCS